MCTVYILYIHHTTVTLHVNRAILTLILYILKVFTWQLQCSQIAFSGNNLNSSEHVTCRMTILVPWVTLQISHLCFLRLKNLFASLLPLQLQYARIYFKIFLKLTCLICITRSVPWRLTHHFSNYKPLVFTHATLAVLSGFSRAQTTASLRSGEQMTGACWRRYAATPLRSPTWPSAMRTPWSLRGLVTRLSECGAYRPVPLWPSSRDMLPLSLHSRYEDGQGVLFCFYVYLWYVWPKKRIWKLLLILGTRMSVEHVLICTSTL